MSETERVQDFTAEGTEDLETVDTELEAVQKPEYDFEMGIQYLNDLGAKYVTGLADHFRQLIESRETTGGECDFSDSNFRYEGWSLIDRRNIISFYQRDIEIRRNEIDAQHSQYQAVYAFISGKLREATAGKLSPEKASEYAAFESSLDRFEDQVARTNLYLQQFTAARYEEQYKAASKELQDVWDVSIS
jgi:hypothetical protein